MNALASLLTCVIKFQVLIIQPSQQLVVGWFNDKFINKIDVILDGVKLSNIFERYEM